MVRLARCVDREGGSLVERGNRGPVIFVQLFLNPALLSPAGGVLTDGIDVARVTHLVSRSIHPLDAAAFVSFGNEAIRFRSVRGVTPSRAAACGRL